MALPRLEHQGAAPATGLFAGIGAGDLSLTLLAGTGYPTGAAGKKFVLALDPGTATEEKILGTARSGATITIDPAGRGYDNTTAQSHLAGALNVEHVMAAIEIDDANDHINTTTRDDHTQYARVDGTRAFTGTVTVPAFVATSETVSGTSALHTVTAATVAATGALSGLTVATNLTGTSSRFVGYTNGYPSAGSYVVGDFAIDPVTGVTWIFTGLPNKWTASGSYVAANATRTTTQSITNNAWVLIQYDTAANASGNFTTGATAKYTVPIAGRYLVSINHSMPISGHGLGVAIYQTGSPAIKGSFTTTPENGGSVFAQCTARLICVVSDTIQGYVQQQSAGSASLDANVGGMTIDFLGP